MKIKDLLNFGSQKLKKAGIRTHQLDSEILLSHVFKKSREFILANLNSGILQNTRMQFLKLIEKRRERFPIAYILGHKGFYGLDFYVNKNVLIPRPETEMLVEETLKILRCHSRENGDLYNRNLSCQPASLCEALLAGIPGQARNNKLNILEIGTGSGCISISILKSLNHLIPKSLNLLFTATDISSNALKIAAKNAKKYRVEKRIKFVKSDLLDFIPTDCHSEFISESQKSKTEIPDQVRNDICFDIIIANLPYVDKNEIKDELKYEPKEALFGGAKPTDPIKKLLIQISRLKSRQIELKYSQKSTYKSGRFSKWMERKESQVKPKYILLEIHEKDGKILKKLAKKYLPEYSARILKDLAGKDRILELIAKR